MKVLFTDYDYFDITLERDIFRQAGIEMLEAQCRTEQEVIAGILSLQITDVSIKATTTEKMGFVGREEGLVCAVARPRRPGERSSGLLNLIRHRMDAVGALRGEQFRHRDCIADDAPPRG